jgi:PAS domain S-box-containing protein
VSLDGPGLVPALIAIMLIPAALHAAWRLGREQRRERVSASETAHLMDTVLSTNREWVWAVGADGTFTFCSAAVRELLGYEPADLLGRHCSHVIDLQDLAAARDTRPVPEDPEVISAGLMVLCRHRSGASVALEVAARPLTDYAGRSAGFEGVSRPAVDATATRSDANVKARVEEMLSSRAFVTAFQPIRCLESGSVLGVEALTRFTTSPVRSTETWFADAASVGLCVELDLLVLEAALDSAAGLPAALYVSLNLSPQACLNPRLPALLDQQNIPAQRIVIEVTERSPVTDYVPIAQALDSLRSSGIRIAVDDAGAGYASMRHILRLKPDLIKLDRSIIADINTDHGHRALGAAMVGLAAELHAVLIAEGIETEAELQAVQRLGFHAGQGYLLGRPSTRPEDWLQWC